MPAAGEGRWQEELARLVASGSPACAHLPWSPSHSATKVLPFPEQPQEWPKDVSPNPERPEAISVFLPQCPNNPISIHLRGQGLGPTAAGTPHTHVHKHIHSHTHVYTHVDTHTGVHTRRALV